MKFKPKRRIRTKKFQANWDKIQKSCSQRKTWPEAVMQADELLYKALKKKGYKGKSTGEKLVAAQHEIKFNEEVWFSHKFSKKLSEEAIDVRKLKKKDIIMALAGFREALRDLGALEKKSDK